MSDDTPQKEPDVEAEKEIVEPEITPVPKTETPPAEVETTEKEEVSSVEEPQVESPATTQTEAETAQPENEPFSGDVVEPAEVPVQEKKPEVAPESKVSREIETPETVSMPAPETKPVSTPEIQPAPAVEQAPQTPPPAPQPASPFANFATRAREMLVKARSAKKVRAKMRQNNLRARSPEKSAIPQTKETACIHGTARFGAARSVGGTRYFKQKHLRFASPLLGARPQGGAMRCFCSIEFDTISL